MKNGPLLSAVLIALLLGVIPVLAWSRPTAPTAEEKAKYADARAVIFTRFGRIVLKFFPEVAPLHVKNFIELAEMGFYNGLTFHRVIPGYVIQGGDPAGNGTGGPGYTIPAEFNEMKHVRGTLSMARAKEPNSAGSQFIIMAGAAPRLDGAYSIFGEVVDGLDVVDKIVGVPRDAKDRPLDPVSMQVQITYEPRPAAAAGVEYSCRISGQAVATADFGAKGTIVCPFSGSGSIRLLPDGSLKGSSKVDAKLSFPFEEGGANGECRVEGGPGTTGTSTGSYGNGTLRMTDNAGNTSQGSYTGATLSATGGRSNFRLQVKSPKTGQPLGAATTELSIRYDCTAVATSRNIDATAATKPAKPAGQVAAGPTEPAPEPAVVPVLPETAPDPVAVDTPAGLPQEPAAKLQLDTTQSAALDEPCEALNLPEVADDQDDDPSLSGITDLAKLRWALDKDDDASRGSAPVPSQIQGALSRSLNQLTRRRFTETVGAAMEGLRLLRGPLPADEEQRFQELWAPLLDFPSKSTVAYLEKLNPLLTEFLSLQQATETAVASQEEVRFELEMAAAYENEAGARELLGLLEQNAAELKNLKQRIGAVVAAVQALGEPPQPQEEKCQARRRTKKALAKPGAGGGAWVRGKKWTQVTWRRESAPPLKFDKNDVSFSANTAEILSSVPGSYLTNDPKEQWPDLVNRWRAIWAEPPAALAGGDKVRMNTYIEDTGCTYFDSPYVKIWLRSAEHITDAVLWDGMIREWRPERKIGDEYRSLVVEAASAGGDKKRTPSEVAKDKKFYANSRDGEPPYKPNWRPFSVNTKGWWPLELKPGQPGWTMIMEVQVHSNYINATACYEYTWDPAASAPAPGQEAKLAFPDHIAAATGGAGAAADPATKAPAAPATETGPTLKEKTDFHLGNIRMLESDREGLERMLAGARDEDSRLSLQYQITCKLADIQAEKDAVATLETGNFTRTRTAWDDMVGLQMQAQSRETAGKIAENDYRRGALERIINLLPPEEQEATRSWARQQLGSGEPDPEKLKKVGSAIGKKAQALNLADGARQDEKAAQATLVTDALENYQTAARYAMYATPFVASGPALAMVYGLAQGSVAGYQTGGLLGEGHQGATGAVVGGVVTAARYLSPTIDYGITFTEGALASDAQGQPGGLLGGLKAVAWTAAERQVTGRITNRIQAVQQRFAQVRSQARLDSWRDAKRRADFTQEREYGKGMVAEHQRRYQEFAELKRTGVSPAQLQAAEARLVDQTAAIMHTPHAKGYLKFNASRAEQAAYASTSRMQTQRVVRAFKEDLAQQGVRVEDLDFRPIRNAGNTSPGMDLDLAADSRYGTRVPVYDNKTNKPLTDAQGQPVTRLIQKVRVADAKSGQTAELDMYSANKLMQGSFNRVYAQLSGRRSAQASWQMVTTGKHLEAYSDLNWLSVGKMRAAGSDPLAAIDPRYAGDAARVTQVKSDLTSSPESRPAGRDNQNWERYRGTAKDIRTKALELLRAKHDDPKTSAATKKEIRGKYKFYYRLAKAMDKANHDPVAADEAVRRLTGFDAPDVINMTSIGIEALGKWK
jgi:cyclophilin family peptidyl-prolyl cis-trans isomerase